MNPPDLPARPGLPHDAPVAAHAPTRLALFLAFFKIGALGFGGVAPIARHVLIDERRMLDDCAFAEAFGLCSALPGANTVNLATMLGDRHHGLSGALVAVLGLMGAPLAILTGAAALYARFSGVPDVRAALVGAAAAAAGLVAGTSLRILKGLQPSLAIVAIAAMVCLASAALKAPMLLILAVAIPLSLMLSAWSKRRSCP